MPNLAMMFSHTDLAIYSRLGCCVEVCGPVFFVLHTMAVLPLKVQILTECEKIQDRLHELKHV